MEAEVPAEGGRSAGGSKPSKPFSVINGGHGVTIPPRSVVRMRMERSEMPFGFVRFEAKARRHADFKSWMDHNLTQADMEKFLEDIGMLRPLQYAVEMDMDRNPVDLVFLISRWSSCSHTFVVAWGEFCTSLEDVYMITSCRLSRIIIQSTPWMTRGEILCGST